MNDLVQKIVACRTPTSVLVQAASVLKDHRELAYEPAVESVVLAAIDALDTNTLLKREAVQVLQQFYKVPRWLAV